MKKVFLFTVLFAMSIVSCDENGFNWLSNDQNVAGLKQALSIGAEKAVSTVSQPGGYLNDVIKISLPQDAQTAFKVIDALNSNFLTSTLLGALDIDPNLENTLTTLINSAAEDAAPQAVNVFTSAITNMTITDGKNILFGADSAATQYLRDNTFTQLQGAFEPTITNSLETVTVGGYTPVGAWESLADINNSVEEKINSSSIVSGVLSAAGINFSPIETNLSDYVTRRALNGLFTKVKDEEYKIRTDVNARTTDLLKDVFGQLDHQ